MPARIKMELVGLDKTIKELARRGQLVEAVLDAAAQAGAQIVQAAANQDAPTPAVETEPNAQKSKTAYRVVDIGPKKEKWFYQFFETGAQPHEISGPLVFKDETGRWILIGGASHPGIPARPFLRPAMDSQKDAATNKVGSVIKSKADL